VTSTRVIAALVGLAVLLPALIFGGTVAVEVVVPLVAIICLDEYARMAFPEDHPVTLAWMIAVGGAGYATALYAPERFVPVAGIAIVVATMTFVTMRPHPIVRSADKAGRLVLGVGWIAGCFAFMPMLRRLDHGLAWVFLLLALAWLADTGAYFAGRAFGKHKLYEAISPKKTWEGYVGGMICTTLGVFVTRWVALHELSVVDALVIGPVLGTAGVIGDLSESMLKRAFDVKDSGWIMPGHGGLLDRVDSVLFIAPLLYGYAVLVKGLG
jgi:phosphatidate cytidylyltransferase